MTPTAYGLPADRDPSQVPDFVRALPRADGGAVAVFDADGTLWTDDLADDYTQWMIALRHIPGDGWPTYLRIYRQDAPAGCRFLLTLFRGMPLATLHAHLDDYWLHHAKRRWVRPVVESLHHLAGKGYPIWVVTGSPTDFMLPLVRMLPVDRVLGMDYALDGEGRITGELSGISCAGAGKADKIADEARGRPVRFCAGNGDLDGPMMEMAEVAWAVYPNERFAAFARERGWPILPRPADFVEESKFAGKE